MAPPTILALAPEIRNTIWVLAVHNTAPPGHILIPAYKIPAIAHVSTQTRHETRQMFYALNKFRFNSDILSDGSTSLMATMTARRPGRGSTIRRPMWELIDWLSVIGPDACGNLRRVEICVHDNLRPGSCRKENYYSSSAAFVILGWWPEVGTLDAKVLHVQRKYQYSGKSGKRRWPHEELERLARRWEESLEDGRRTSRHCVKGPILRWLARVWSVEELLTSYPKRMLWLGIVDPWEPFDHAVTGIIGADAMECRRIADKYRGGLFGELLAALLALLIATLYNAYQEEEPLRWRLKLMAWLTTIAIFVVSLVGVWCGRVAWRHW